MKKKTYLYISIAMLALSIIVLVYGLSTAGIFNKHKIIVRAVSCTSCPTHEVVFGNSKLSSQMPDSADKPDVSKAFLTGMRNPDESDYTKTYDYFIVTISLTNVRRTIEDGPQYPVLTVSQWQEVSIAKATLYGLIAVAFLIMARNFYRRFIRANTLSVLKRSVMLNEDIPD